MTANPFSFRSFEIERAPEGALFAVNKADREIAFSLEVSTI